MSEASPRGTYLIIAESLRQGVESVDAAATLPSEAALMAEHGVSRTTVRRALRVLADDGLIESAPGVGWRPVRGFVTDRRPLVERVAGVVATDGLAVGDAFPSESALCQRFGASRTAVRSALAHLEGRGVLATSHGRGRTVRALPDADPSA
ncbi:GntR family transcriptional regulator [Streptomyces sp. NPDC004647]|uniref:GntR family transcriptional regulator n=1 Tax=Streptomyces sp. NPDC004647 TaxID=3154671 RepID=UPI0033A74D9B